MLKKIHLDRTRTYEIAVATKYIAEMLDAYLDGRKHALSLGCEQGDIKKWDDLIIEHNDYFEHIQVKRQLTNFSSLPVIRGNKASRKTKNINTLQDRSPLDESLASLAEWSKEKNSNELNSRRFVIEVPDFSVGIKKGYQVRHLCDLCNQHISDTATQAALVDLEKLDSNVKNGYIWLTKWCGFEGWNHIIKAFRLLEVRLAGIEVNLVKDTEDILSRRFLDGVKTRRSINSYISENSSYTAAIKPRKLLSELESELIGDQGSWTQYKKNSGNWDVSGTTNLQDDDIESPQILVQKFWNSRNKTSLKIMTSQQSKNINCKLSTSLMRFSLHFEGNSSATFNELDTWLTQAKNAVAHSLGISGNDFEPLNWLPSYPLDSVSENRELKFTAELEKEAKCLSDEMYKITWIKVCELLSNNLSQMENIEIRDAIEERWFYWKSKLELDVKERDILLKNMLHPKSEGEDVIAELRVGSKSVSMITEGIKFLLIVSIALYDAHDCWKATNDGRTINTLALSYWGGPSGRIRYARELTDDNGIEQLLGKELDSVLIMSKVQCSASDIFNESLAFSLEEKDTLSTSKAPDLLVTNSMKFKRLVNRGTLQEIKDFFEESLKSRKLVREESIQGVIG